MVRLKMHVYKNVLLALSHKNTLTCHFGKDAKQLALQLRWKYNHILGNVEFVGVMEVASHRGTKLVL